MAFRIKRVYQVTHAVNDLDEAIAFWTGNFGVKVARRERSEEIGLEVALVDVGNTYVELIRPLPDEKAVRGWLDRHGQGLYLLTFEVEDVLDGVRRFHEQGWRIIEAWGPVEEKRACFIHPRDAMGVYVQIAERVPGGVLQ